MVAECYEYGIDHQALQGIRRRLTLTDVIHNFHKAMAAGQIIDRRPLLCHTLAAAVVHDDDAISQINYIAHYIDNIIHCGIDIYRPQDDDLS